MERESSAREESSSEISAREVFGRRVDRYAAIDIFSDEKFYQPLIGLAGPYAGMRVLDVACGTGLLTSLLARDAAEVVGMDVTPEMLGRARERIDASGQDNVTFVEAEAARTPFDTGSFDLVTCRTAFHHFPEPEAALGEMHRVLRVGGRLVLEDVFGPDDGGLRAVRERFEKLIDPSHVMAYRPAELRAMLADAGFSIEREVMPETEKLALDLILQLDRVEDPGDRDAIVAILEENLDVDLGGFRASRIDGELVLHWQTMMIAAVRNESPRFPGQL